MTGLAKRSCLEHKSTPDKDERPKVYKAKAETHDKEGSQHAVDVLQPRDLRHHGLQLLDGHLVIQLRYVTALLLRHGVL